MSVSKALERLLRIREVEEEQHRVSLESALGELHTLERACEAAHESERQGRAWVGASVESGEIADRQAGLVEAEAARKRARVLQPRIAKSEMEAALRRAEFLDKRLERRQAATLIEATEVRDKIESDRRGQRDIDDWFGAQRHRASEAENL